MLELLMPRREGGLRSNPRKEHTPKKLISGIVEVTRKGVGYVAWPQTAFARGSGEPREDIEIFPEKLNGALNGDTIEVELLSLYPRPRGRVRKIVERAKTEFVCTVVGGKVIPDDQRFKSPIEVARVPAEGTKLLVELLSFDGAVAKGNVLEEIGKAGEHRAEMNAIVLEHGFRTSFPADVEKEAESFAARHDEIIKQELPKRADFRNLPVITIDPATAKDFDDALSLVANQDGTFEVGVHIADASFYARPGTAIGEEARKRGTSVYLVDATIPMLPHAISGGVASLMPNVDRLAFSGIFKLDQEGRVLERRFTKSVINSKKRFTYEEAQAVLNDVKGHHSQAGVSVNGALSQPFAAELNAMLGLATQMRARRSSEGAIDFGDNEVKFELDENGKPLKVVRKERIDTNWLIEEFMLLCNREVADYVSKLAAKVPEAGMVFLYRIHDEPKADRIDELATFVRAIGYEFGKAIQKRPPLPKTLNRSGYSAKDIQKLLREIEGKPEEHLIRTATLRSMAKAIYSTKNIGHFGLSFKYYTHFTSPIRRYPDMLAHMILESHLDGRPLTRKEFGDLEKMCIAASEQEAKAVQAERDSIKYKLVEYMIPRVGQTFDAVVSGVTEWGLYVEDKETSAEGLVRVRSINDDIYNYSPKEYALVGQRTQKKYALGDPVRVKLVNADLATRQLDFELA